MFASFIHVFTSLALGGKGMWRGEQDEQNHPFPLCSLLLSRGTGRKGKFGGILKWIDDTFPPFPYKIKRQKSI